MIYLVFTLSSFRLMTVAAWAVKSTFIPLLEVKITSNLVEDPFIKTFYMELNKKSKYFL